jgi:hypothetical protein
MQLSKKFYQSPELLFVLFPDCGSLIPGAYINLTAGPLSPLSALVPFRKEFISVFK